MTALSTETMTTTEKIAAMETLWSDLCQHSSLESPDWHETVLKSREQQRSAGKQPALDWDTAKEQIRQKVK